MSTISFGIAIYLSPNEGIKRLIDQMRAHGFRTIEDEPGQVFHISLVNAETQDLGSICESVLNDFISCSEITFDGPFQFDQRNVSYLNPCNPAHAEIIAANQKANELLIDIADVRPFYRPLKYTPHMTLAGGYGPDMRDIISKFDTDLTFSAKVIGYGIASWSNGHITVHKQWPQQGGSSEPQTRPAGL
jgi:2'-5' RNA ligase